MKRLVICSLLAWGCLGPGVARAEQATPRDLWPQAAAAAESGDVAGAIKQTGELTDVGRNLGIRTFPVYAEAAAGMARQAGKEAESKAKAEWAIKAADQLDPNSPAVAFSTADRALDNRQFGQAIPAAFKGYARVFTNYRSRLLSRCDTLIVAVIALAITAAIFAIALFVRYGRSMAHDFREILGERFRGGSVTVLAVAMLFLPVFLWLGPGWLLFYWFVIFFSYATPVERVLIVVTTVLLAMAPIVLDLASHWTAGVDSPVVVAAIASEERAYYPGALHRMQELVSIAPQSATLELLLGNLQLQEANDSQAGAAYRRSLELHETAGAHVNLGNLHFIENDFPAAITEYEHAEQLDPKLAIAYYNHSVASGELYKFDDQAAQLDQARRLDRVNIERLSSAGASGLKIAIYRPPISTAWDVAATLARGGVARSLFGNYSWFDPFVSARNPVTLGAILTLIAAPLVFFKRRRTGLAGACIKCGRTFCHRCKSARESATYCTQCIHIYLKRDGVSLDTKRSKLEEVHDHQSGIVKRNRLLATFFPGSAQLIEGRTIAGTLGVFAFVFCVLLALSIGRLAPVLTGDLARNLVRVAGAALAIAMWLTMSLPVYKRRASA
jgi:tetratricopeptide (TPR) repeat protein